MIQWYLYIYETRLSFTFYIFYLYIIIFILLALLHYSNSLNITFPIIMLSQKNEILDIGTTYSILKCSINDTLN